VSNVHHSNAGCDSIWAPLVDNLMGGAKLVVNARLRFAVFGHNCFSLAGDEDISELAFPNGLASGCSGGRSCGRPERKIQGLPLTGGGPPEFHVYAEDDLTAFGLRSQDGTRPDQIIQDLGAQGYRVRIAPRVVAVNVVEPPVHVLVGTHPPSESIGSRHLAEDPQLLYDALAFNFSTKGLVPG
jgi:hypothetical protein